MNAKINTNLPNPFSDSQARNYSDERVLNEFCPISQFWSLFNDQHEIIIGTRGCGKTILLKMMRYSMLAKLNDPQAQKLVREKKYIAFYVPLHLEFIKQLSGPKISCKDKLSWFRFSFNCSLAQAVLIELSSLLDNMYPDVLARTSIEYELAASIGDIWGICSDSSIHQITKLRKQVDMVYYKYHPNISSIEVIPNPFIHSFGSTLSSISNTICTMLNISPTWIICVDEAEFLEEDFQKCINTSLRSDTGRIAIKVATLPFHHVNNETMDEGIKVIDGQDFNYKILNMKPDGPDFVKVTNSIIRTRFLSESVRIEKLEEFVETIGNDQYIDYYLNEIKNDKEVKDYVKSHADKLKYDEALRAYVYDQILLQISDRSKKHNGNKSKIELKKTVLDKLAPVYYLREIKKREKGRYIPGWYAGASMIRRISQGNPRIFIRIMNALFDAALGKSLPISIKTQHKTIEDFAKSFCNETETLERFGPEAKMHLSTISEKVQSQTHEGKLTQSGLSFSISDAQNLNQNICWIHKAVAFSRLMVDSDSLRTGITTDSIFVLSNLYAVNYYLPMRARTPIKLFLPACQGKPYSVGKTISTKKKKNSEIPGQISLSEVQK